VAQNKVSHYHRSSLNRIKTRALWLDFLINFDYKMSTRLS